MEGECRPAELTHLIRDLRTTADEYAGTGEWLADAMQASWDVAAALVDVAGLEDVLGDRHRIIANDWLAANMSSLIAASLVRAADILDDIDFAPVGTAGRHGRTAAERRRSCTRPQRSSTTLPTCAASPPAWSTTTSAAGESFASASPPSSANRVPPPTGVRPWTCIRAIDPRTAAGPYTLRGMCQAVRCRQCGKTTWAGCGAHVEQVLGHLPAEDRCTCVSIATDALGGPGHQLVGAPSRTLSPSTAVRHDRARVREGSRSCSARHSIARDADRVASTAVSRTVRVGCPGVATGPFSIPAMMMRVCH